MAHVTIPDTSPRVQYTVGGTSTTDFSIPYAYFEDADIVVYVGATLKVLTTDYTITGTAVDEGYSGGTVVLNTGVTNTTVTVIRDVPAERITDFPTNGPFNITQLNSELDRLTAALQQEETSHDLYLKVAEYDTYTDLTLPDFDTRKGKFLYFDSTTGDPEAYQVVGVWQGSDATTTTADYVKFDIVKDSSNSNVYICTADSTTGTLLTNTSYWALLVDAASAASSASSASGFADEAEEWATKVDGIVESTDYSSKAWSIGGTGVTTTSGKGAAKEWATSTGAAVDTSEYSAKEYAVGDLTATGGSAKAWAIDSSSPDGSSEKSAKTLAGEAATSASNAATSESNAADWAVKTDGIVDATDYAAKAWSIGGTGVTTTASAGAAKEWATTTGGAVDTSEYSAKEYAKGDLTATGGSAKAWAIDSSSPDGGSDQSAKTNAGYSEEWANKAEDSLISTAAGGDGSTEYSARHWAAKAQASLDSIENFYLGASATAPTVDDNGDPLAAGDWYFNTTDNLTYIYNGSSWQVTVVSTAGLVSKTGDTMTGALILNSTDALTLPVGTDAQRPTPVKGMFRFNDDSDAFEGYDGAAWGAVGGGNTAVVGWENQITVAENYTITTNNNMMSAGPITIDTGYSVTIPTGSTWTIV